MSQPYCLGQIQIVFDSRTRRCFYLVTIQPCVKELVYLTFHKLISTQKQKTDKQEANIYVASKLQEIQATIAAMAAKIAANNADEGGMRPIEVQHHYHIDKREIESVVYRAYNRAAARI